jgi:hypothetical protein
LFDARLYDFLHYSLRRNFCSIMVFSCLKHEASSGAIIMKIRSGGAVTAAAMGLAIAGMASATGVEAQTLLTSAAGYTGPALYVPLIGPPGYVTTSGPVALSGGVTYTSTDSASVIYSGGSAEYALGGNGGSFGPLIGTNDADGTVTLTFATPVESFGAGFNYAPGSGSDPTIAAYTPGGVLIASYDLATLAPISTPGETNAYDFRGIDGDGQSIGSFTLSGSFIIASAAVVPEPATWTILLLGLAGVGVGLRRRNARAAAAA